MMHRPTLYLPVLHVRSELLNQARQTITVSDSLTASPNPPHLHRTQRQKEKFLSNFWKNRRRRACARYRETKQYHQPC